MTYFDLDLPEDSPVPTIWPLAFLQSPDITVDDPAIRAYHNDCALQLDRGNAEFGVVFPHKDYPSIMHQLHEEDQLYFTASEVVAVCTGFAGRRVPLSKVCVQLSDERQVDLSFMHVGDAQQFVAALKVLATNAITCYEAPRRYIFMKNTFLIIHLSTYCEQPKYALVSAVDATSELSRLWKMDDTADFVVHTDSKSFKVHRAVLSLRSEFFKNVCKLGFMESAARSVQLEEDSTTVEALLMEIYGVRNHITGSVFTNFALEPISKKDTTMKTLLSLFIATDKYCLEPVKLRAARAFLDRIPFTDTCDLLGYATVAVNNFPERDFGLRASIVRYVQAQLPVILREPVAAEELSHDASLCLALLRNFGDIIGGKRVVDVRLSSRLQTTSTRSPKRRRT